MHPVEVSLRNAPVDDEPLTEEDRKAIDEANAENTFMSTAELRRRLGLEARDIPPEGSPERLRQIVDLADSGSDQRRRVLELGAEMMDHYDDLYRRLAD